MVILVRLGVDGVLLPGVDVVVKFGDCWVGGSGWLR